MGDLIVLPESDALKAEIETLRAELSALFAQRDELIFVVCKNIETEYMLKIGGLEHRAYRAQCTYLRLKRKLALIQAKLNRQEAIDLQEIDALLDEEFAEYQAKLDEQIEKMSSALARSKLERLSEEESKELKKLYRQIVKALHPDLHPDLTDAQIELFYRAVEAYEHGNLPELRIIAEMIDGEPSSDLSEMTAAVLMQQRDRLEKLLETVRQEIETIKTTFPYSEIELLKDDKAVEARKAELRELIEEYESAIQMYQERIDELMRWKNG